MSKSFTIPVPINCCYKGVWIPEYKFFFQPSSVGAMFSRHNVSSCVAQDIFKLQDQTIDDFFVKKAPVSMEICSGNGSWVVSKARSFPEYNWLAVERRFDRAANICKKSMNIPNIAVVCAEGELFCRSRIKEFLIDQLFINFPDPWSKRKHAKHRLISENFVNEVGRIMKPTGKIWIVTDDFDYAKNSHNCFVVSKTFVSTSKNKPFDTNIKQYGSSYFEQLWRSQSKNIYYLQFSKL